jgi:hypothetical protein
MRAGALDGLSIGFRTVKGRTDPKSGVRRLDKIDLWEISIVTFPMLPEARVSAVKRRQSHSPPVWEHFSGRNDDVRLARLMRRAARLMRPAIRGRHERT